MRKAERLSEIFVGQRVYTDEKWENLRVVKMVEDKLVPYIVTDDNSCHCLYKGIWILDQDVRS